MVRTSPFRSTEQGVDLDSSPVEAYEMFLDELVADLDFSSVTK